MKNLVYFIGFCFLLACGNKQAGQVDLKQLKGTWQQEDGQRIEIQDSLIIYRDLGEAHTYTLRKDTTLYLTMANDSLRAYPLFAPKYAYKISHDSLWVFRGDESYFLSLDKAVKREEVKHEDIMIVTFRQTDGTKLMEFGIHKLNDKEMWIDNGTGKLWKFTRINPGA